MEKPFKIESYDGCTMAIARSLAFTLLLALLLLTANCLLSCGSAPVLTKADLNQKQAYVDAYYDARNNHIAPFNNLHFYEVSDSVAGTVPPDFLKLLTVYKSIDQVRISDSLWAGTDDFPLRVKYNLDINFLEAKGVAK